MLIKGDFPAFADAAVLSAVRWHTTGRAGMPLAEALLYLADYIEEGRTFPDCVALRDKFFAANPKEMDMPARLAHLAAILVLSLEMTVNDLTAAGSPVCQDTLDALSYFQTVQNPF